MSHGSLQYFSMSILKILISKAHLFRVLMRAVHIVRSGDYHRKLKTWAKLPQKRPIIELSAPSFMFVNIFSSPFHKMLNFIVITQNLWVLQWSTLICNYFALFSSCHGNNKFTLYIIVMVTYLE